MKKSLSFILSLFLCLFCLIGCGEGSDEHGFFSQQTLDRCLIPDLPKIRSDDETSLEYGMFNFATTEDEFVEYLNSVYEYLVGCSFEYFGYPSKVLSTFFGGAPKCDFKYGNELSDFQSDVAFYGRSKPKGLHYFFVWGNNGIEERAPSYDSGTSSNPSFEYSQIVNAYYLQIGFYPDENLVWNAYVTLPYAIMDYTFYLPVDDTEYELTVNDPHGFIMEPLKETYRAGENVTVKTEVLFDVDMIAYLDGVSLGSQTAVWENDEYHWEFYFVMPAHNATLTFTLSGDM